MKPLIIYCCLLVLVSGCAVREPMQVFESPGKALELADAAADAGRWSEAIAALDTAIQRFPEEARLVEKRRTLGDEWDRLEPLWEDQLVATQARALFDEIIRMERLLTAQPERVWLALQLKQRKTRLRSLRAALLVCAERRRESDIRLAKSCAWSSDRIASDVKSRELVAMINQKIAAQAKAERERQVEVERTRLSHQVDKAEKKIADRDYSGAAATVSRVLAENPNHARAKAVKRKLVKTTSEQNTTLNNNANEAYANGDIDGSIRFWEASLRIVPDQPEVKERLERAQRVLKNLEDLKAENPLPQQPAIVDEPATAVDVSTDL